VVWSAMERSGKPNPVTYYAPIEDSYFEMSLPAGDHACYLAQEVAQGTVRDRPDELTVPFGLCHVRSSGTALVQKPSRYGMILGLLLGHGKPGLQTASIAASSGLLSTPLSTIG